MKIGLSTDKLIDFYKEKIKKEHLVKEIYYNKIYEYLYEKYTGNKIKIDSYKTTKYVGDNFFYFKITILEKYWVNHDWFLFNKIENEKIVEDFLGYLKYDLELEVI